MTAASVSGAAEVAATMRRHAAHFERRVYKIADGIHLAVGFAAANVAMIEGRNGLTIIDTTEGTGAARQVLDAFRDVSGKPVTRIVYTHSHRDHISGAAVFADGGDVEILGSAAFSSDLVAEAGANRLPLKALQERAKAQFGFGLSDDERIHIGLGPGKRSLEGLGQGFLPITRHFAPGRDRLDADGAELEVFDAPGETADHVNLWMERGRILFCGDNFYHAFPNLYAIRGTAYRDFDQWARTLDALADRKAEILVPGHSRPVFGAAEIEERLRTTAAAIRSVIAQAIDGMNAGRDFDEIAASARLPDELAGKPWLAEHYGSLAYSAKACCVGLVGWYDGRPERLIVRDPAKKARDWLALLGGAEALPAHLRAAASEGNGELALELCELAERAGCATSEIRRERRKALLDLAAASMNAPARNSLFTAARAIEEES